MRLRELWLMLLLTLVCGQAHPAAQLRLGALLGDDDVAGFARAEGPRPFQFPRDHGPHRNYRSEWWYLTANLRTSGGDAMGVQFTLFRQALRPEPVIGGPWDATQVYLAHLAVTDVAGARHLDTQRLARAHPRLAGVAAVPFRAWIDGWSLEADGPGLQGLVLDCTDAAFAVHLRFDPQKPIVLQGDRGWSAKGPGQASYYYSIPRLTAVGEIRVGDEVKQVRGAAWFDREWSTSVLSAMQVGWDWFALQLESGEELMAYRLRRRDGLRDPYDQGTWVGAGGETRQLRAEDFTLEPRRVWTDADGVAWPVAWDLTVMTPGGPRQLRVEAALDDQRMVSLLTYWEGLVRVFDEAGERIGLGYMELTGYE